MDSELSASERSQLIDFARSMVERARQAGLPPLETEQERRPLPLREDPDPRAVLELLSQYRNFFERTRSELTREVDAVLLVVERLEKEIAVLRGEIRGLRNERQELLERVRRTELDLATAADEFARQISGEVAGIAGRLTGYIDEVSETAASAPRGVVAPASEEPENCEQGAAPGRFPAPEPLPNGEIHAEPTQPSVAEPGMPNGAEFLRRGPATLMGFVRSRTRRRRENAAETDATALADRARDARQWDMAARLYRDALAAMPDNAPIWVQYGHALKESGNKAEAETAYRKSIQLDPGVADTHLQLGHVLKLQGKQAAAAAAYLRALSLDPALEDPKSELIGLGWTEIRIRNALH